MRHGGVGGVDQALEVDVDHPLPFLRRRVLDRPQEHLAGVVDDDVEPAQLVDRAADRGVRLLRSAMSASIARAVCPALPISFARRSSRSSRRAASATLAPSAASSRAVASPIPLLAPVTSATVPSKEFATSSHIARSARFRTCQPSRMSLAAASASTERADTRIPEDQVIVLFGATGDLARRKLLPGMFHLAQVGLMPQRFRIIGAARRARRRGVPRAGPRVGRRLGPALARRRGLGPLLRVAALRRRRRRASRRSARRSPPRARNSAARRGPLLPLAAAEARRPTSRRSARTGSARAPG